MRGRVYVAAAGVFSVLVVGACSHGSGVQSAAGDMTVNAGRADSAVSAGGLSGSTAQPSTTKLAPSTRGYGAAVQQTVKLSDPTAKIRIADLTVAVSGAANVAHRANDADAITAAAGGEVDSDDRTSGRHATATLQLRVPPGALQDTLRKLSALGRERSRQLSTTDVTQQVADVTSRIISARDSINRLRVLYANAHKVRDVIQIEDELNTREADLESLQARQRTLQRQTALATVNLSLVTASKKAVVAHKHHTNRGGFIGGLDRGWDGFVAAAAWVANAVGTLLPFLALLIIVAAVVRRWGWPRHRPAPTAAPAPSE